MQSEGMAMSTPKTSRRSMSVSFYEKEEKRSASIFGHLISQEMKRRTRK